MQQIQQLTDKDIAGDVLTGVKYMAQGYMMAVMESNDQNLRQTFKDFHDQCLNDQYRIFQVMNQHGWYKVPMILDEAQAQPAQRF
ncbi:MAG: spore coat protein [Dethiobacter sp.]|jgi:spore coat protein CotF|nr:MAG: spore coat protein [Dethiobacter sp.]